MTITRDDPRFWDVRTLERRMRRGQVTKKDYEKYLKTLPDVDEKKATIQVANVAALEDEDDFDDIEDEEEDEAEDEAVGADAGDSGPDGPLDRDGE